MAAKTNAPRKAVAKPKTQRSNARGAAPERDDDEGIGDEADGVEFNPDQFLKHVENIGNLKSRAATIRGDIGAAVKNAEEDHGIDRWCASVCIKLKGMSEEHRAARLKGLRDMFTALGWGEMADLFDTPSTPAESATFAGRGN